MGRRLWFSGGGDQLLAAEPGDHGATQCGGADVVIGHFPFDLDIILRDAIRSVAGDWISGNNAETWLSQPDTHVIGQRFSPACYIAESTPASLYLAWRYHDNFDAGILANGSGGQCANLDRITTC